MATMTEGVEAMKRTEPTDGELLDALEDCKKPGDVWILSGGTTLKAVAPLAAKVYNATGFTSARAALRFLVLAKRGGAVSGEVPKSEHG